MIAGAGPGGEEGKGGGGRREEGGGRREEGGGEGKGEEGKEGGRRRRGEGGREEEENERRVFFNFVFIPFPVLEFGLDHYSSRPFS